MQPSTRSSFQDRLPATSALCDVSFVSCPVHHFERTPFYLTLDSVLCLLRLLLRVTLFQTETSQLATPYFVTGLEICPPGRITT
jgi:hypothetical protein